MSVRQPTTLTRYGGWIPANPRVQQSFIDDLVARATKLSDAGATHTDPVANFNQTIQSDPEMVDLFNQIFFQVSAENKVADLNLLLYIMDIIIVAPPGFHMIKDENGDVSGEPIGVPLFLFFDLLSNTAAAYDLFRKPAFIAAMKKVLDAWGNYLQSADSTKTLTNADDGWFGSYALGYLEADGRGQFNDTYLCPDPDAVDRGFASYDAFFTRKFQPNARPVLFPDDNTLIYSACESTVYRIQTDVKAHDQFWLKGQAYSLYDMLDRNEDAVQSFVGGTVYQAFLGPQDYHRWHSPINGTIVRAEVVEGSYYVVLPDAGAEEGDPDFKPGDPHGALIRSQAYITTNAPRAIIFIQSDNPDVGLVAFIGVGMAEVSTCELTFKDAKVSVGDELGMFHFGGSTHALIFGPNVALTWETDVVVDQHVLANSVIAQAAKK